MSAEAILKIRIKRLWRAGVVGLLFCAGSSAWVVHASSIRNRDWRVYGGKGGDHYSDLNQINRSNVKSLQRAWSFDTGERGTMETTPLVVGRVLIGASPSGRIFALDGATGKRLWIFDCGVEDTQPIRGFSYWEDAGRGRVLVGIMNFLYELDLATGRPVESFGEKGRIDLRRDLGIDPETATVAMTSPGVVYKDLIIVGFRAPETHPAPHGDIRAYDLRSGKLRWAFHTIPHPGEFGYDTWPEGAWKNAGAANAWAGMSLDEQHGVVYVPTGSAVNDFYGGDRVGADLFANTLLALNAETGKRLWNFQGVHHDLLDRDFPAPPALLSVMHDGKRVDAVAQTTKQGYLYLFDRLTGKPLFPVEEMKVSLSTVPGEVSSATQPRPLMPAPFSRQNLTEKMLTERTPEAHAWALAAFREFVSGEGQFTPLSLNKQTVVMPGFDGGAEWGGPAVDPRTGVLYVNANDIAYTGGLVRTRATQNPGAAAYMSQCAVCHGEQRKGSPPQFPSLIGITDRLSDAQIADVIHEGRGRMPTFPNVKGETLQLLIQYLRTGEDDPVEAKGKKELQATDVAGEPYHFTGYQRFVDPDGYPAVAPPWGTLNAIDMSTGRYLWKIPFGEYPELTRQGIPTTGSENYGGPVVTAGGLLFIGATVFDRQFHAYNSSTGELLWHTELPYGGLATPVTYMIDGKQYVAIAAGGGKDPHHEKGGVYVSFKLP